MHGPLYCEEAEELGTDASRLVDLTGTLKDGSSDCCFYSAKFKKIYWDCLIEVDDCPFEFFVCLFFCLFVCFGSGKEAVHS